MPQFTFNRNSEAYSLDGTKVGMGEPRFVDTDSKTGILIEEKTENLIKDTTFENWTNFGDSIATITQNQEDPFGGLNGTRIQTQGGTNTLKLYYSLGVSLEGENYTSSIWVKNLSETDVIVYDNVSQRRYVNKIDGWVKVILTGTGDGSKSLQLRLETSVESETINCLVYQPQLENKGYATSYIDGTRSSEKITLQGDGVLFNEEGTIELLVRNNQTNALRYLFDTSAGERFSLYRSELSDVIRVRANGSTTVEADVPVDRLNYIVVKWNGPEVDLFVNGAKYSGVTSGPLGFSGDLTIGSSNLGANQWNDIICGIRISNIARSDEEIALRDMFEPFVVDKNTTACSNFERNLNYSIAVFRHTKQMYNIKNSIGKGVKSLYKVKEGIRKRTKTNYNVKSENITKTNVIYRIKNKLKKMVNVKYSIINRFWDLFVKLLPPEYYTKAADEMVIYEGETKNIEIEIFSRDGRGFTIDGATYELYDNYGYKVAEGEAEILDNVVTVTLATSPNSENMSMTFMPLSSGGLKRGEHEMRIFYSIGTTTNAHAIKLVVR